jgi:hypothetical protein
MTLSTFGALKTAVADWAFEGGAITATLVGTDFFPQVQSQMYYGDGTDIAPLRIRAMENESTVTPATGGIVTISTDVSSTWLEFIELVPTQSGSASINYIEPWQFRKMANTLADTTNPQYSYTVEGDKLYLAPAAVGSIKMRWLEKFTAVSGDSDTDWIILNAPQVYLNGCLMHAAAYTDDQRESTFRQKFAAAIKALNMNDKQSRASGSRLVARPRVVV